MNQNLNLAALVLDNFITPKGRLNPEFKNGLNETANIVTHLTKSLIDLGGFGLASQGNSKLRRDHVERGFDVRPLVIALHEPLGVVVIQMVHAFPNRGARSPRGLPPITRCAVRLKGNVGLCVVVYYGLQVLSGQIGLIRAHFLHREVSSSRFNQSLELGLLATQPSVISTEVTMLVLTPHMRWHLMNCRRSINSGLPYLTFIH